MSLDYDHGASMEHPHWLAGCMDQHWLRQVECQQNYYNPLTSPEAKSWSTNGGNHVFVFWISPPGKRALAKLVKACSWEPAARQFDSRLATKRIPSPVSYSKHSRGSGLSYGQHDTMYGWARARGFSRPILEGFLLNTILLGRSFPRQSSFFLLISQPWTHAIPIVTM